MKFGQNVYLDEIWIGIVYRSSLESKTRSRDQINEKPCVDDNGLSFHQIFMKFSQKVCLDEIWLGIVYGLSGVKN